MNGLTPMMRQYMEIKELHKDALLFFRMGDFYEMFFEDALIASKDLEIALTGRDCGLAERAPMCGVPHHAVENYIARLIEKGHKVAICEQTQEASEAKGLVERQVTRVVTPGTILEASMLEDKTNNYLLSIFRDAEVYGFSGADISTGEFFLSQAEGSKGRSTLLDEVLRLSPREILVQEDLLLDQDLTDQIKSRLQVRLTPYHDWAYQKNNAYEKLLLHFKVQSLEGFGCQEMVYGVCAAGALLEYLTETQKNALSHVNRIKAYYPHGYLVLDAAARRNLEITETLRAKGKRGSLLWHMDKTRTALGGRLLRQWVQQPLIEREQIELRLGALEALIQKPMLLEDFKDLLDQIYDLERLISRITCGTANARDLLSLKQSLSVLPTLKELLQEWDAPLIAQYREDLDLIKDVHDIIEAAIAENPPVSVKEGGIIQSGYNAELDEYRLAMSEGKTWIASLEVHERERTGIKNLKIGFNKVFGYYLDVTRSYFDMVPVAYIRKQTLANSERYITPELKTMEEKILGAEEMSIRLEYQLFTEIREQVAAQTNRIQTTAGILAALDALWSLAKVSAEHGYTRPTLTTDGALNIVDGRHPVVEKTLPHGLFVPNHTHLNTKDNHLMIITGPNMAGKSTYMRQVALIVLMAQIGCFVPAKEASVGIVDRIFTRVGASDDLASGQSTFMVEMSEVANILHNATPASLLVLDEIGRGTSTFDGLSIAWAVIEHICHEEVLRCKTLFATHYHELTELEGQLPGVRNYCISVKEQGEDIIFLRRIVRGGADKSLGIQVAKLAGLPAPVLDRARQILARLEEADINKSKDKKSRGKPQASVDFVQMDLFNYRPSEIEQELKTIDINQMTPMEAMRYLDGLIRRAKG